MLSYFIRRLLLSIPTLIVISWVIFGLNKCSPYDPITQERGSDNSTSIDQVAQEKRYRLIAAQMGLDVPPFYFSLSTTAYPDTLYLIYPPERRTRCTRLAGQVNNWPVVNAYDRHLLKLLHLAGELPDSLPSLHQIHDEVSVLSLNSHLDELDSVFLPVQTSISTLPNNESIVAAADSVRTALASMKETAAKPYFPLPVIRWNGLRNEYHRWMAQFFTGDFGTSLSTRRPVAYEIKSSLVPTLTLNGIAIFLAYCIAIPLGVRMSQYKNRGFDRWGKRLLLVLYSFPVFWLGSLFILGFATSGIGFNWVRGLTVDAWTPGQSVWRWIAHNAGHLVLPIFTLLIHILAILALQMRSSMLEVLDQEYIKTARAKGLAERGVYSKHALKNALFPLITIFGSVFPVMFAGSLVIEHLFNYPGMGTKTQRAFVNHDYPVLYAILMIAATLTILGSLVADWLYAFVDPRVRFGKRD